MNCPQCGTQLQDRAIYCPACGIQARCKQCREELVRDARVCMLCGAPASPADANLTSQLPIVNRIRFVETDKRRSLDAELTDDAMAPWFAQAERRLNIGVWLTAPPAVLEARLGARHGDASDATVATLRRQMARGMGELTWREVDATDAEAAAKAVVGEAL